MPKRTSLIGLQFGRLKVLAVSAERIIHGGRAKVTYDCLCECGKTVPMTADNLRTGQTKSCGCLALECRKTQCIKHGQARSGHRSSAYTRWINMIRRCSDPKDPAWHNYGGRGITVCDRWKEFSNFYEDMGDPPPGLTLDRKDNNGDYCKENCHWVTRSQQGKNTRRTRVFTVQGITACANDLAKHFGIDRRIPMERINRYGWNPHDAFTKPIRKVSRPQRKESVPPTN